MKKITNEIIIGLFKRVNFISLASLLLSFTIVATRIFFPFHRIISVLLLLLGIVFCIISAVNFKKLKNKVISNIDKLKNRQFFLLILISLTLFALFISSNVQKNLNQIELKKAEDQALIELYEYSSQQLEIIEYIKNNYITQLTNFDDYAYSDIDSLQAQLKNYINIQNKITVITNTFAPYYHIPFYEFPSEHQNSFLISKLSYKITINNFKKLNQSLKETPYLINMLNLPNPNLGLVKDTFSNLADGIFSIKNLTYLIFSDLNESLLKLLFKENENTFLLRDKIKTEAVTDLISASKIYASLTLDKYEQNVANRVLPIQKSVLLTTSYIKYYPQEYRISNQSLEKSYQILEPGDILLQRREWQLTNVGITGFWTHSAIMLKEKKDFIKYFAEVMDKQSLLARVKEVNPLFFEDYFKSNKPFAVIESNRDGVILQSHKNSNQADFLSAMSPKASKEDRLNMILEAIKHYKKPYDYNFDYLDSQAIACSELVYKSLKSVDINLPLTEMIGRLIVSPQYIAESKILNFKLFINTENQNNIFDTYENFKNLTFNY